MTERRSDEALVEAAIKGDESAFNDLTECCRAGIVSELTGLMGNINDAEDVAQEAFLRGFLKMSTLREPYNFGGWVRQIARNIARNRLSRDRRFLPLDEQHANIPCIEIPDETRTDTGSLADSALAALSRLPSKLRETTRLTYLSSYTQKQVSRRLHIPLGTVKRRLWESRMQMRKDVLRMSRIGRIAEPLKVVPGISIKELPEKMEITAKGPGLYFGTILETGNREVCRFFDYPGGILTQTVQTQVVRKLDVLGMECFEVLIEHSDCEPSLPNTLDYFTITEQGFRWIMRVTADENYPQTRFIDKSEQLFPSSYASIENDDYSGRVVDLTIGSKHYGKALAVFWGWENGTPAESFYTSNGRQVLHRRYVGQDAPESGNYRYESLMEEVYKNFRGRDYRLWYDTVLTEE
jgi:RNA polymerase sigma-70 factor, ECF subfamily